MDDSLLCVSVSWASFWSSCPIVESNIASSFVRMLVHVVTVSHASFFGSSFLPLPFFGCLLRYNSSVAWETRHFACAVSQNPIHCVPPPSNVRRPNGRGGVLRRGWLRSGMRTDIFAQQTSMTAAQLFEMASCTWNHVRVQFSTEECVEAGWLRRGCLYVDKCTCAQACEQVLRNRPCSMTAANF